MGPLAKVWQRPELLGTTWRNRATGEIAVVLAASGPIHLIDVDWEPQGKFGIADVLPVNNQPKYWLAETEDELRREWRQVKAGWVDLDP